MIGIYYILSSLLFLTALPFLGIVYLLWEKRRANLFQRLGVFTGFKKKESNTFRIWIHALSVGEVRSAVPFVLSLKKRDPLAEIIFTVSTKTGFDTAQEIFFQDTPSWVSQIGYFPMDFWFSVKRVSHLIEPDLVCLVETDLWPGFLSHMKQRKVPVVLINARLSQRSLKGYLAMGRFSSLFFSSLSHIMAQTPMDAQGFKRIGMKESSVSVMGNIKFDQAPVPRDDSRMAELKAGFGIGDQDQVWIAGSTHEGEEIILIDAFTSLKKKIPNLKLILAPRDPKRGEKLMDLAISHSPILLSQLKPQIKASMEKHDLVFIDRLGKLATAYAICDIAFIGGSLVPQGGHNPLEPAMFGKPILFGPHMTDFSQVACLLLDAKGACQVETDFDIQAKLEEILTTPALAAEMGQASHGVFIANAGAVDRILKKMEDLGFV